MKRIDVIDHGRIPPPRDDHGAALDTDADVQFMKQALGLAVRAMEEDEVPVGALIVRGQKIVGMGWNQREALRDPTAHAEMVAITQAAASLSSWRLEGCTLYVTLEPCPMCAGAILQSRIPRVVYGAADPKAGAVDSLYRLLDDPRLNHRCTVTAGVMAQDCGALLSHFFKSKRAEGKK
ncbi:MAG: tRNA adenosine(34) deaminase TadA [Planctomycetota bacterium]|nr:MAG: tRNA adenosine(34) deaminase TadA [Planctomycetota bacterium]